MCIKAVDNDVHALELVPQEICNRAVSTYPSTIQFVPDQFKTQEMCIKAVDTCPFAFNSFCS